MQKAFRAMQRHGLIVADNGSDLFITGTYDPRWNNDILNPAFSALTANDFEVIQLGYNPPPKPPVGINKLRATLNGKTLVLAWDSQPSTVKYQVQAANRVEPPPIWKTVAETSANSWSSQIGTSVGTQFFRVLWVRP